MASPLAGVYPLHVNCSRHLVVDGQFTPKVPSFSFTVAGVGCTGGLVGPQFGDDVILVLRLDAGTMSLTWRC